MFGKLFQIQLYKRLSFQYDIVINFVEAHEEVIEILNEMLEHPGIKKQIIAEVTKNMKKAEHHMIINIEQNFEEVTEAI